MKTWMRWLLSCWSKNSSNCPSIALVSIQGFKESIDRPTPSGGFDVAFCVLVYFAPPN